MYPEKFIGERDELVIVSLAMMPLLIVNMNVNRSLPGDFTSIVMILSLYFVGKIRSRELQRIAARIAARSFFADIG